MPIDTKNPTYSNNLSKWTLVRDCVSGAKQVRSKGVVYLPNPDQKNDIDNNSVRYKDFKKRAQFLNVTARTRNSMVGMAFRRPPVVDVTGIEYIINNATGSGTTLEQLGKVVTGDLLEVGRIGLLVDYPESEPNLSKEQVTALGFTSSIKVYTAENIINWKTSIVGGQSVLSLVVLMEEYDVNEDEFDQSKLIQYRKLCLIDGVYNVIVYRDDLIHSVAQPRANGQTLNQIPFIIAGTYSNDPAVDDAALYDIAEINIGHYVNSASYEEGIDLHGQPMLHIDSGTMTSTEWSTLNPNGVEVGARRGIVTAGGGSVTLVQAVANGSAAEAMTKKEAQMVSIGARLIEPNGQAETAEASRIKHAGDNSVLANVVQNASEAIQTALGWVNLFMGVTFEPVFQINEDFYDKSIDPQTIVAKIQLFDRGIIGKTDIRGTLRKAGEIERDDEEIEAEAIDQDPTE